MKIAIVDDHALFCEGMSSILSTLSPDINVLTANQCDEAIVLAQQHPDLDIMLHDIGMPDMDGCVAVEQFCLQFPTVPVVMLSASTNTYDMRRAFDAGAMGYIDKSSSGDVVLSALRLVLSGGMYIPPALAGVAGSTTNTAKPTAAPETSKTKLKGMGLTERQHQVLMHLRDGLSNKEIARHLGLANGTIKSHVTDIMKTLGVQSRTEAAVLAREITPDPPS